MTKDLEMPKFIKLLIPNDKNLPSELYSSNGGCFMIIKSITTLKGEKKYVLIPINNYQEEHNKTKQLFLITNFKIKILKSKRFLDCEPKYLLSLNNNNLEILTFNYKFKIKNNTTTRNIVSKLTNFKILQIEEWNYPCNDLQN